MTKKLKPEQKKNTRRGGLSNDDKDFILSKLKILTPEQMAARLRRSASQVRTYIKSLNKVSLPEEQKGFSHSLMQRPEWKKISKQFTPEELEQFKHEYVQLMGQFKDDVLPTEEIQIFELISIGIHLDRLALEQKMVHEDQAILRATVEDLREQVADNPKDPMLKGELIEAETKYDINRSNLKNFSDRYDKLSSARKSILKDLKATRDQRVKVIEDSKQSFLGLLRALQNEDFRREVGEDIELNRVAANFEYERLSKPHKYRDGTIDQPLLTPENIGKYDYDDTGEEEAGQAEEIDAGNGGEEEAH